MNYRTASKFGQRCAVAAGSCLYLFTAGIFSSRHRPLITKICEHFGHDIRATPLQLPRMSLVVLGIGKIPVQLREPAAVDGNTTLLELLILSEYTRRTQARVIFEFGTFNGRTALNLAANSPGDTVVYTIDLPRSGLDATGFPISAADRVHVDKEDSGALYRGQPEETKIRQLCGDTATYNFGSHFGLCDLVFVDAAHSHEYVVNDSEVALKLLRPNGGAIFWHDYGVWDGVTSALNQLQSSDARFSGIRHIESTSLACLIREPARSPESAQ